MNITKLDYKLERFDEEDFETFLNKMGINANGYIFAMTKPSLLSRALIGNVVDFSNRNCFICFSDTELNLIMLSRISNKHITELIKIEKKDIVNIKLSNILISYMMHLKTSDSTMKFQIFKKVGKFSKAENSIKLFKSMYI